MTSTESKAPPSEPESNLVTFARTELDIVDPPNDAAYDGMLRTAVLDLVRVFAEQGHSGMSAGMTVSALEKLLRFEPLSPLTGEASEWVELDYEPDVAAQNKRCSHVFRRADGTAYDSEGRVFEDPDGSRYTSRDSRVDITFPYVPTREVVQRAGDDQ